MPSKSNRAKLTSSANPARATRRRISSNDLNAVIAATIKEMPLQWLWPGFIPDGKVTILAGMPGLTKSFLTIDLAARISSGSDLPIVGKIRGPGSVLLISPEDEAADTIVPRLRAAGADSSRIHIVDATNARPIRLPRDLPRIRKMALSTRQLRLIVLDPLAALVEDTNRDTAIRAALSGVVQLASELQIAVVIVVHLNKSTGRDPLLRIAGSTSLVGLSRQVLMLTKLNDHRRLLTVAKSNLASQNQPGISYHLKIPRDSSNTTPTVEWEGFVHGISADDAFSLDSSSKKNGSERARVRIWLVDELRNGPLPAKKLFGDGRRDGISIRTLRRASHDIGVVIKKRKQGWEWSLPESAEGGQDGQHV